ncbi:hypothetical protein D3C85_1014370 [compost metagenome]
MAGNLAFLPGLRHAVRGQPREAGAYVQLLKGFVLGPGFDLLEPGFEVARLHLATVDSFTGNPFVTDHKKLISPLTPGLLELDQCSPPFLQTLGNQLGRRHALNVAPLAGEQATNPR